MSVSRRWTVADLDEIEPKNGERYEVIDGELFVSPVPSWHHQYVGGRINTALDLWSSETQRGTTLQAPGLVFSVERGVIPDLVWISWERLREAEDRAGHFTLAPELVVEVLSPGSENVKRDRETKLAIYSEEGVREYWIVDQQQRTIDVYRQRDGALEHVETIPERGVLESPLLPGFRLEVERIWPPAR